MEDEEDLEVLGEQLYDLIYPKHAEIAGKLTGMLLELPGPVLTRMQQDEAMLTEALEKALSALQLPQGPSNTGMSKEEDEASASSDSLGEQLFELVDIYNTGHTQKITGMLLEQHKEAVLHLLSEPSLLEEQVNLALKTLQELGVEETDVSDSSDADDTERLEERLFLLVQEMDAVHSNDITGMLLEMDPAALRQMLSDRTMLEGAVQKAQAALESLWIQEITKSK
uniref:PABC domain-containing protein n=1 Tax=Hucho hucho TaxID=62062 RepID=A0A4W5Q846_9TELE